MHLRGPIELTQKFLPLMKKQNWGALVFTPSSGAVPYMGAYEVFKTAQVELANTLAGELENTEIKVFCIGPGLVKTHTAATAIEKISLLMGISIEDFYSMNASNTVSTEEAGTGVAVSLLFKDKYNGTEIGAVQALMDAGIMTSSSVIEQSDKLYSSQKEELLLQIKKTFDEQYEGWKKRNIFERQWMLRDFKKQVSCSAEEVSNLLITYVSSYKNKACEDMQGMNKILASLRTYYIHQLSLMQGYIKDQKVKDGLILSKIC